MAPFLLLFLVASLSSICNTATSAPILGVNYGTLGNNLPAPNHAIKLIQSMNGGAVRIYDANSTILQAAFQTNLTIAVSIPNNLITSIGSNQSAADTWIATNVLPFGKNIKYIFVGNEVLSNLISTNSTWPALVPAMTNMYRALQAKRLKKILVSTPFAMDCVSTIYPPSLAQFRADIPSSIISSLLKFLNDTNSYYFVNAYPYLLWSKAYKSIPLDYPLFRAKPNGYYTDPLTNLTYTNLLDNMLDSSIYAMKRFGYNNIKLGISETGWPNGADYSQISGSVYNAAIYTRNLAHRLAVHKGTPLRPGISMPAFVSALFNENLKAGAGTECHLGLFYPNETAVYPVDLTGRKPIESYPLIPLPTNNKPYPGKIWCVLKCEARNSPDSFFREEQDKLCNYDNNYCSVMANTGCFLNSANQHNPALFVSFEMNYLWQQSRLFRMPCDFDGYAQETIHDPSINTCIFPARGQLIEVVDGAKIC